MKTGNAGRSEIPNKGQSLVEMAIIVPVLIFFLMGILEIGIVLRNYLVLLNANQEVARFTIRPGYLNPEIEEYEQVGYEDALLRMHDALGEQVFMDFVNESALVINVVKVDTGFPCDPDLREPPDEEDYWPNCDCELIATQPYTPYIIANGLNDINYSWSVPISYPTRFDIESFSLNLAQENDQFNCQAMKTAVGADLPRGLEVVIVEMFYQHHQAFGFPLISNPYTDPFLLHTYTIMRRVPFRDSPYEGGKFK